MGVGLRAARVDDLERLLLIWRSAVEESHQFLTPADLDWYDALVEKSLPLMNDLRVAVDDRDIPVGFLAQDGGHVHMLFVEPQGQGCGVGTALLGDVIRDFPKLRVEVNEQNHAAHAFYAARGFRQVGRSAVDGQGRPFPLLHLEREPSSPEKWSGRPRPG